MKSILWNFVYSLCVEINIITCNLEVQMVFGILTKITVVIPYNVH